MKLTKQGVRDLGNNARKRLPTPGARPHEKWLTTVDHFHVWDYGHCYCDLSMEDCRCVERCTKCGEKRYA